MSEQGERSTDDLLGEVRVRRKGLRSAMDEVETAISAPAPARLQEWRHGVEAALANLARVFDAHVELTEGQGGLFEQVVEHSPRLSHSVSSLKQDHEEIRDGLKAVRGRSAPDDGDERAWIDALREDVLRVLGQLSRHRHRGADLLHEAYSVDISESD